MKWLKRLQGLFNVDDQYGQNTHIVCGDEKEELTIDTLIKEINRLYDSNAMHRKRGFSLQSITAQQVTNQLLEEAVELQGEVIVSHDREGMIDESADVLITFFQLMSLHDISIEEIVRRGLNSLDVLFTTDPEEVLTDTPGFTRRTRVDPVEARHPSDIGVPITKPPSAESIT